jgi:superfamily II DNA or RNA helicase
MSNLELTEAMFAKLAGWEAVKQARSLVASDRVLSSDWQPPLLKGTVQEGSATYRAGLVIKSPTDAENLCHCRQSRQWGQICAHSVAVGLHFVKGQSRIPSPPNAAASKSVPQTQRVDTKPTAKTLRRASAPGPVASLEIHVILPPNFAQAAAKDRVMLVLEGETEQGRAPLNTLPLDKEFSLSAQDNSLLEAFEKLSCGDTPAIVLLNKSQLAALLPTLVGHPRVTAGKSQSVEILHGPFTVGINATLEANGEISLRLIGPPPTTLISGTHPWVFHHNRLQPLGLPPGLSDVLSGPVRITRSRIPQFLNLDWPKLITQRGVTADFSIEDFTLEDAQPSFKLHLTGGLAILQAKLECYYADRAVTPGLASSDETLWIADPKLPTTYRTRNFRAEQNALSRLTRYGFAGPDTKGFYHLNGQNAVLTFFAREFPKLEKDWSVTLEERLERSTQQNLERIEPRFQITPSGEQWFDFKVTYASRHEQFAPADVQRLLLSGQSHTRLKTGKFALLDTGAVEELQEVLLDCAPQQHAQGYRVSNAQAGFLDATLRQQSAWRVNAPTAWTERAAQQRGETQLTPPALGHLDPVLRPYQKQGIAWLHFLRANGFGGILADEMGLGKTLQVLALLAATRGQSATEPESGVLTSPHRAPSLVVCPTSLVSNWVAEAAKFTPGLRVLALEGSQRHQLFPQVTDQDLVVTSYALLRRDADEYRAFEFDTVVLDEAQHIKNRQTQNAQAVKSIRSRHRLVLTGTPLENSVLDLWSIFDFLMPGYLGTAQDFRDRYEGPIVREKSAPAQDRLARRLRPFVLRRLKRDVATDLPDKIEQVSLCELSPQQRALYNQVLEATRQEIFSSAGLQGGALAKTRMLVLTALLRLRQICCDLRLLESKLGDSPAPAEASGKIELFDELVEEVLDGGHRVLVFSQFTTMLALLQQHLTAKDIQFSYLDGSTPNRAQVVDEFQRNPKIPIFLISLKAGGVGLNLTGADTVIHFDPWWNPAVEAQATDRAHRIGQTKIVTSYKLIARDTVEEKILHLQTRKRALIQGILGDEEQFTANLNWQEIQELLAGG